MFLGCIAVAVLYCHLCALSYHRSIVNVGDGWANETLATYEYLADVRVQAWAALGGVEDFTNLTVRVLPINRAWGAAL